VTTAFQERRPNIVMILSDDHAAHAVSAYGSMVNTTARIDEIAQRGALFKQCYVTNSLCAPSRASILTGTFSHVNGVKTLATHIDASQPTFVSQLREAGYHTAIVGKWHLGDGETGGVSHNPQGFDYWDVLIDQGEYFDPRFLSQDGLRTEEGYATNVITDLSLGWLERLEGDEPWCLLICHKAPHRPWEADDAHKGLYAGPVPVPATFDDDGSGRTSSARRACMSIAENLTTEDLKERVPEGLSREEAARWKYQRYMQDYLECVASVDDNVGRVIDWLDNCGEYDDTVLIYTSDQGFFLGDHGWFDKRYMYEESLLMPLVLSYPREIGPGQVHDGVVTNVDFAKSLLEAAGAKPHERMQGRSFWGDLTGGETEPPAEGAYYRYWEHDDPNHRAPAHYGWTNGRHKIIYFYNDGMALPGCGDCVYSPEWELYDLEKDPDELRSVYHDPEYAEIRDELKRKLWQAQAAVGDNPHPSQPVPDGVDA
jgi:arylsulfatase A-like enzyme